MISNFILQTCSAPGTSISINLIAASTGRLNFSQKFSSGAAVFYIFDDGTQAEWGYGTLTTGSPDTLSRDTVVGNSANTTARLNFTTTGVRVYNEIPAENSLYRDKFGVVTITEPASGTATLTISAASDTNGANLKLLGNGSTTPSKTIRVFSGALNILNDAYTTQILILTDAGLLTVPSLSVASATATGGVLSSGYDAGGLNYRATFGSYGAGIRIDASYCYFLNTASGSPLGTWNTSRPIQWNLATGAMQIDGSGSGTTFGGAIVTTGNVSAGATATTTLQTSGLISANAGLSVTGNITASGTATAGNLTATATTTTNNLTSTGTATMNAVNASGNIVCAAMTTSAFIYAGTGVTAGGNIVAGYGSSGGGYTCKSGSTGAFSGDNFNLYWSSPSMNLYVDSSFLGAVQTVSDQRYKHEIAPLADTALDRINRVQPVHYRFIDKGIITDDGIVREGFLAQALREIIPSAVLGDEEDENHILSLQAIPIIAVLLKAVQELSGQVTALTDRVLHLENPLNTQTS